MAVLVLVIGAFLAVVSGAALDAGVLVLVTGPQDDRQGWIDLLVVAIGLLVITVPAANVLLAVGIGMIRRPDSRAVPAPARPRPVSPAGPAAAAAGPSLAGRAVLAVALTVGFYTLAIGLAVLLLAFGTIQLTGGHVDRASLFSVLGGLAIAWSILPRRQRFTAPGPLLDLAAHPLLAEQLRDVATRVGEPMPSEVYVTLDMNAGVSQRAGRLGRGRVRFMVLGLPLMQLMTVSEFRAVLAHEFGHYSGGDTALGPWVYRTRRSMARTVRYAGSVSWLLWLPFRGYALLYLRITQAISRRQEYAADALAARAVGAHAMSSALGKLDLGGLLVQGYWQEEVNSVVRAGRVPPLMAGFSEYTRLRTPLIANGGGPARAADPYDSHPPTAERLAALAALGPVGDAAEGEPAATSLLGQLPAVEEAALLAQLRPGTVLRPIAWEQVGDEVLVPQFRTMVAQAEALLRGATLGNLVEWARSETSVGQHWLALRGAKAQAPDAAAGRAGRGLLAHALMVALAGQGWSLDWPPGAPARCRRGAAVVEPFTTLEQMAGGTLDDAGWARMRGQLGIADASLAATAEVR